LQGRKQISALKKKIELSTSKVKKLFNPDQLKALQRRSTRGLKWELNTIKKALKLRFACGSTGYKLLLQQGHPLPAIRTLQVAMSKVPFSSGVLKTVFAYLKIKVKTVTLRFLYLQNMTLQGLLNCFLALMFKFIFHSQVDQMSPEERNCCLTLDEMKITEGYEYDRASGSILGDTTLPSHSGPATHGLVFMLAGKNVFYIGRTAWTM
jgi:hypothetical protein